MMNLIKNNMVKKVCSRVAYVAPALALVAGSSAFADSGIDSKVVVDSVQSAVTHTISMMSSLLPVALTVFATTWGVKKAIRFFKGASN